MALAKEHCLTNTRSRHFGCVVCTESGEVVVATSNNPERHAEENFLHLAKQHLPNINPISKVHMFVTRVTAQGALRLAKPCSDCLNLLKECSFVEIDKVYYTNENGVWICESLQTLSTSHTSMKKLLERGLVK